MTYRKQGGSKWHQNVQDVRKWKEKEIPMSRSNEQRLRRKREEERQVTMTKNFLWEYIFYGNKQNKKQYYLPSYKKNIRLYIHNPISNRSK